MLRISSAIKTQDFLNMELAFKYEMCELLRHEKFPETHVLVTLLSGNALLFNEKKDILHIRYQRVNFSSTFGVSAYGRKNSDSG